MTSAASATLARYSRDLVVVQRLEPLLERQGQEEPRKDLHACLQHPELLQQLYPVAVHLLIGGLVPAVPGDGVAGIASPSDIGSPPGIACAAARKLTLNLGLKPGNYKQTLSLLTNIPETVDLFIPLG